MITPEKLLKCLQEGKDEVFVEKQTADAARTAVERMIAIGNLAPANRKSMTTELITPAESFAERTDVLIIGSGAAGLTAALTIVEADPTRSVTVITRGEPADSSTAWAQGGLAAVISRKTLLTCTSRTRWPRGVSTATAPRHRTSPAGKRSHRPPSIPRCPIRR